MESIFYHPDMLGAVTTCPELVDDVRDYYRKHSLYDEQKECVEEIQLLDAAEEIREISEEIPKVK